MFCIECILNKNNFNFLQFEKKKKLKFFNFITYSLKYQTKIVLK